MPLNYFRSELLYFKLRHYGKQTWGLYLENFTNELSSLGKNFVYNCNNRNFYLVMFVYCISWCPNLQNFRLIYTILSNPIFFTFLKLKLLILVDVAAVNYARQEESELWVLHWTQYSPSFSIACGDYFCLPTIKSLIGNFSLANIWWVANIFNPSIGLSNRRIIDSEVGFKIR